MHTNTNIIEFPKANSQRPRAAKTGLAAQVIKLDEWRRRAQGQRAARSAFVTTTDVLCFNGFAA